VQIVGDNTRRYPMTYCIRGLEPGPFDHFFALDGAELAAHNARRVRAAADRGFPCRVSLRDADEGEELLLVHHVNHDVATPYRNAFAIYVREGAEEAAEYVDACPPVFEGRPLAFRCYDADGNLRTAALAMPGEADATIRRLLGEPETAYIDAHNAAHGCFAARIGRYEVAR
jgi:hypothetical protein